jgi:hypothetical protein
LVLDTEFIVDGLQFLTEVCPAGNVAQTSVNIFLYKLGLNRFYNANYGVVKWRYYFAFACLVPMF